VPEKFLRDIYHFAARGEDTEESVNRRRTKKWSKGQTTSYKTYT